MTALKHATIAFDLDGTLVDTAPDLIGALNTVLAGEGLPPTPLSAARRLIGGGARRLVERGFAEAGHEPDPQRTPELVDRLVEVYLGRISRESRPFEGLEAALDELAHAGARLAVCTNKREGLSRTLLDALGLTGRFAAIVGSDSVPAPKPDPGHLLHAVQAAGGDPGRALFVGDSITDLLTARAAAVPAIGVSFGYSETAVEELGFDRLIHSYGELPRAAADLLAGR
jgi:phosphoglycolate phosphatase